MEYSVRDLPDGATALEVAGRLNMVTAGRFREVVGELVASGKSRLVVDLSETSFLDSSGLGALISGLKTAREAGGDLRLAAPTEQVQLVLKLTNMDRVLAEYVDAESAYAGG